MKRIPPGNLQAWLPDNGFVPMAMPEAEGCFWEPAPSPIFTGEGVQRFFVRHPADTGACKFRVFSHMGEVTAFIRKNPGLRVYQFLRLAHPSKLYGLAKKGAVWSMVFIQEQEKAQKVSILKPNRYYLSCWRETIVEL